MRDRARRRSRSSRSADDRAAGRARTHGRRHANRIPASMRAEQSRMAATPVTAGSIESRMTRFGGWRRRSSFALRDRLRSSYDFDVYTRLYPGTRRATSPTPTRSSALATSPMTRTSWPGARGQPTVLEVAGPPRQAHTSIVEEEHRMRRPVKASNFRGLPSSVPARSISRPTSSTCSRATPSRR